jgi:hypothetical protein
MVDEVELNATLLLVNTKNDKDIKHVNLLANASQVFPIEATE